MLFASHCLNIPYLPHDYGSISQALRLDSLSFRCNNFDITFIKGLIEGQVDAPRFLGELNFCIPSNTRLQSIFYIPPINLISPGMPHF
ncbi:Reverse transcriptase domain-containing protein [Aphis craccivora]|uniref:Reverse transcriptase domain-containing protein n=1 Tax=Aphis craccivora TaxID=307492 RepID=A0A6G0ZQ17_APHCR|nr:Reverse transcriptase domain-containing protein [Aphis craccivora]